MLVDNEIDQFIVRHVADHPRDIVGFTAEHFGHSRQSIHKHVRALIDANVLSAEGQTRARRYTLVKSVEKQLEIDIEGLEEDVVWRESISPSIERYPENIRRIAQYGFTEILNNAIVHSQGDKVRVGLSMTEANAEFVIWDDGIGIFRKIKEDMSLEDERHSILQGQAYHESSETQWRGDLLHDTIVRRLHHPFRRALLCTRSGRGLASG
jgi:glucose-6-phosphate-specific signal transduction histidine kinase